MKIYKILFFACLFPFLSTKGQTIDSYYKKAQSLIANNNYSYAILYIDTAIKQKSNVDSLYTLRAHCYLDVIEYKLAFNDCNKALKINPQNFYAYYLRGLSNAKIPVADSIKNLLLQQYLNDTSALMRIVKKYKINSGEYSSEIFDYGSSIEDYTKSIEINPKFSDTYYQRALLLKEMWQEDKALDDYNKSIELKPDYSEYYYTRAWYYRDKKETQKSIDDFNESPRRKRTGYH
ncbi:MAG: hypothetical protein HXX18_04505 [Bacteroidetes bacterium]|nr:hypothetical protein [Bacteroidota bacterium]